MPIWTAKVRPLDFLINIKILNAPGFLIPTGLPSNPPPKKPPGYLDGISQIVESGNEPAVADDDPYDPWLAAEMYDYKTKTFHLDRREGPMEEPKTGEECVTRVIDSLHSLFFHTLGEKKPLHTHTPPHPTPTPHPLFVGECFPALCGRHRREAQTGLYPTGRKL